jgi:hypothetical protein
MTTIDRLIFDALAERRSVSLPGEGTLEVKHRSAKMISDNRIVPPGNRMVFTPGHGDDLASIISLIMADRGVGEDEAGALYSSWLESARRPDGSIAIEGVCERLGDDFTVAEELDDALNPEGEEPLYMEPEKRSGRGLLWTLLAILAVLVILGVVLLFQKGCFSSSGSKNFVVETIVTAPPATEPAAADSLATESTLAPSPVAEARFYVIAGAFSVESNADNLVKRLKSEHPELTPEKVAKPSGGTYMVSIVQAPTRAEADRLKRRWESEVSDLWVYEQK